MNNEEKDRLKQQPGGEPDETPVPEKEGAGKTTRHHPKREGAHKAKKPAEEQDDQPVEQLSDDRDAALQKLDDDLAQTTDQLLRTAAEFDNYRKRTEREKQASIRYGCGNAVERLLPVLDTLERAADAECSDAEYKKGVLLTVDVFKSALQSLGVEEIPARGQPFDPELHCAVTRESDSGQDSGTIVSVLQKGYKMGDGVIRHAMVTVAD